VIELSRPVIQVLQVVTVVIGAPAISGFISWFEARLRGRRGPRILQPYFDLAKLFRKESLVPPEASSLFRLAPFVSFACYLTVPMLIPVLTSYALPLGYMGDILGGGLILAFASFLVAAAAAETGDAYAQLASSRAKTFAAITEPVMLLVFFAVALITTTDLPYVVGATVRSGPAQIVRPAHLLASAALFMVILYETARIPVETHTGTTEFGMIEAGRPFEYSGPDLALLHWVQPQNSSCSTIFCSTSSSRPGGWRQPDLLSLSDLLFPHFWAKRCCSVGSSRSWITAMRS
jgi:formate hydrogenlyase subunit 4